MLPEQTLRPFLWHLDVPKQILIEFLKSYKHSFAIKLFQSCVVSFAYGLYLLVILGPLESLTVLAEWQDIVAKGRYNSLF